MWGAIFVIKTAIYP